MSQTERFKRALERAGALAFSGTGCRFVALRYAGPRGRVRPATAGATTPRATSPGTPAPRSPGPATG